MTTKQMTTVQGNDYEYWNCFVSNTVMARELSTGRVRRIKNGVHMSSDLAARKAIAVAFDLASFRK